LTSLGVRKMKRVMLGFVALIALSSLNAFAADCDANRFKAATGCQDNETLWSRTFESRLHEGFFSYCKQYAGTRPALAVLTSARGGNVVVVNKSACTKTTFKADDSG